jgi:2-phospho-L-lactate guanylyltransferase (CobY/MobA/RfbA family)
LAQAAAHATARGAQMLLILPCDLPLLDAAALSGMLALYRDGVDRVIAPDRAGSGTNALLVDAAARDFAFGENSFARHMQLAASSNLHAVTYSHPAMAFDLDTVPDYLSWLEGGAEVPDFLRRVPAGHGIKTGYGVNSAQP